MSQQANHAGRLVCVTLDGQKRKRDRLTWAISFDDKESAEQVREKIRRKMGIAKLLAGALTLGLTVILGITGIMPMSMHSVFRQ